MKCIYCLGDLAFNKEHVIPQFLGTFTPINPTLKAKDKLVCQNCNSKIFSALETEFKEDSCEGVRSQMLNFDKCNSVRVRGKNVKMECLSGLGDKFFNEVFPFLEIQNGNFLVKFKPQIKIRNYADGYQIFLYEAIKDIKRNSRDFKDLSARFSKVKPSDIALFGGADSPDDNRQLHDMISFLKECGVNYQERERKYAPMYNMGDRFEVAMECLISPAICRFVAKVAFNYFAFCALVDLRTEILFELSFDKIKRFVLGDATVTREEVVVQVSDDPITYHEKESGKRIIGHLVVLFEENGNIYSKVTFWGNKVYKVLLGKLPSGLQSQNFGCGHMFYPFDKTIHNLIQLPKQNPSKEELRTSFGLNRRLVIG